MSIKTYAGIGNRVLPKGAESLIKDAAERMNALQYVCRTGGAPGADALFEKYAQSSIVYLPWRGFNGHGSPAIIAGEMDTYAMAVDFLRNIFDYFDAMDSKSQKFYVRNLFILHGADLNSIVDRVIFYNTQTTGGTVATIKMAKFMGIPVENLA